MPDGHQWPEPVPLDLSASRRQADRNERFVAFTFAGADMVVETDQASTITYAAGAVRSRFGFPADQLVGQKLARMVAPVDHDALDAALLLLQESGRLPPLLLRLADPDRSRLALAGIALKASGRPLRLCLTFARPPMPLPARQRSTMPHALCRKTEALLRQGAACDLGLLEVTGASGTVISTADEIGEALERLAPESVASEVAPGRFGLLGPRGTAAELGQVARTLEQALRHRGLGVSVAARPLPLDTAGLTATQAARALRQALNMFTRDGAAGFDAAGFEAGLGAYVQRAEHQAASLRQAIQTRQFSLAYQPIVRLADRAVHHYEALIRPKTVPGHGFATPQEFIMAVEALGLADELDLAVVRLACDAARRSGLGVAVNLSGQSVQDPVFREQLTSVLAADPACKAGLVMVEMTETAEIVDVAEATRTAEALRALGVAFCLDDFGAGAADIRLLRALGPDIVKLDGSYVPGVADGGREHAFVAGMVEIARAAHAGIVAERIETEAEGAALHGLGVQYGQGWLYGRPGPLPTAQPARARKEGWG